MRARHNHAYRRAENYVGICGVGEQGGDEGSGHLFLLLVAMTNIGEVRLDQHRWEVRIIWPWIFPSIRLCRSLRLHVGHMLNKGLHRRSTHAKQKSQQGTQKGDSKGGFKRGIQKGDSKGGLKRGTPKGDSKGTTGATLARRCHSLG